MNAELPPPRSGAAQDATPVTDYEGMREEYHKADVALRLFLEKCHNPHYLEKRHALVLFIAVLAFVVTSEIALIFYFLGENLGTASALYASMVAVVFIACSAFGAAFSHANSSVNLPAWRRLAGFVGIILSVAMFLYGLGMLSGWRADSVAVGFSAVMDGYRALAELPVFVTALVNAFGFALLTYETRAYFWPRYWGYRPVYERYSEARGRFKQAQQA